MNIVSNCPLCEEHSLHLIGKNSNFNKVLYIFFINRLHIKNLRRIVYHRTLELSR